MTLRYALTLTALMAPFFPMLVHSRRNPRPEPDLAAIDRAMRMPVTLTTDEEDALWTAVAWLRKHDALLDEPMRAAWRKLAEIEQRCAV